MKQNKKMAAKKSVIKLVNDFISELKKKNISIRRAILFGSHAKGNAHKYSDIDVAIVADEFEGVNFIDLKFFMDIKIKKKYALISTQTFNSNYFKKGDAFIQEIIKSGIEIK